MDENKALVNLVKAARKARQIDDSMVQNGYTGSPYHEIYGLVADAIYILLGEESERSDDSVTYRTLNSGILTDMQAAAKLTREYRKHHDEASFHVPENAFHIISEAADERQISAVSMTELILNQWALQHRFAKAFAG